MSLLRLLEGDTSRGCGLYRYFYRDAHPLSRCDDESRARRLLFFCIFVRCLSNSTQRVYEDRQSLIAQYWESSVRFACVP